MQQSSEVVHNVGSKRPRAADENEDMNSFFENEEGRYFWISFNYLVDEGEKLIQQRQNMNKRKKVGDQQVGATTTNTGNANKESGF